MTDRAQIGRLVEDLRHYPSLEFRARLRAQLERRMTMSATLVSSQVREGFTTVTPYVMVSGAGLGDFLARVFGAEETFSARGSGGGMHREIRVGNSMIMVGEVGGGAVAGQFPARPAAFHVYVDDVDAAFARAIAAGATSLGAPADRPYGERSGFIRDAFGNHWYIATHLGGTAIPPGLNTVTPYLLPRQAAPYIEFVKRAFGAVEEARHEEGGRIAHAVLRIGNAAIELGQATEPMPSGYYLYVGDPDALYAQAIAAGAKSLWEPADQSYGDRVGAVEDAEGNQWFLARPGTTR
jgi:PhnB protein